MPPPALMTAANLDSVPRLALAPIVCTLAVRWRWKNSPRTSMLCEVRATSGASADLSDDVSSDLSPEALAKQEASGVLDDGAKSESRKWRHRSYRSYRSHLTKCPHSF